MYSFKTADGDVPTETEVKQFGRDSKRSIIQSKQRRGKWILTYRNTITTYSVILLAAVLFTAQARI